MNLADPRDVREAAPSWEWSWAARVLPMSSAGGSVEFRASVGESSVFGTSPVTGVFAGPGLYTMTPLSGRIGEPRARR